jgi:acylphosphatase
MIKKKIIIKGQKVHDVGYRLFLLDEAEARLIPFLSVKNIRNKAQVVEVLACGEEDRVERFIEFVTNNFPDDAEVNSVSVEDYEGDIRTIESFSRSFSISQLSKIARTGVAMLNLQSDMNDTLSNMNGVQSSMNESIKEISGKQDIMIGKQDIMIGKQDDTITVLKEFRKETGENFQLLHSDNLKLQEIMVKHDIETKELFGLINREISGIKERLVHLESAGA